MLKKITTQSIALTLFLVNCTNVFAGKIDGDIEGFYVPTKGWAESQELHPNESVWEQLGQYNLVLKRKGWDFLSNSEKNRIREKLVIKGPFHGLIKNPQTAPIINHQLSSANRDGTLFTKNDGVILLGIEPCSETGAIIRVEETLKFQNGIGIYKSLQAGGSVVLNGSIDTCTSQNEFDVIGNQGGLCFGTASCD